MKNLQELCTISVLLMVTICLLFSFYSGESLSKKLTSDIKESRHREDILAHKCQDLDYQMSVLIALQKAEK